MHGRRRPSPTSAHRPSERPRISFMISSVPPPMGPSRASRSARMRATPPAAPAPPVGAAHAPTPPGSETVGAADHVEHDLVGAGADPVQPQVTPAPLDP